jgi:hypothetical protein
VKPSGQIPSAGVATSIHQTFPPADRHRSAAGLLADECGFMLNAMGATIFIGLVLTIVVYTALDMTGTMSKLGHYGPLLPLVVILWLMYGIYRGINLLKVRSTRIRLKGPLFMRSLMSNCLERTCGLLQTRLNSPAKSSSMILNDILQDKMLDICATDCLRFSDIRRRIEDSRLRGTTGLVLANFFQTPIEYRNQDLPEEIRQVADMVSRSRTDLRSHLETLQKAHETLCTSPDHILALLPPDPKKVERMRAAYRYRPPTPERAQRMMFALETLDYIKATRYANVNPLDRRRYDDVAGRVIPELANGLKAYQNAWQELVDAYEQPRDDTD